MQLYEEIRKIAENHRGRILVVFPAVIMLIYIGCECFHDFDGVSYYIYPALINGLMILSVYLAWHSYIRENASVIESILLSGIAVILPFAEEARDWFSWDWAEKVSEFVWLLWPALIVCLSSYCVHKLTDNRKYICGMNLFLVFLLAIFLHWFAEETAGEKAKIDLWIPAIWFAEGILWTFVLHFTKLEKHRKRNLMMAWIISLILFGCFIFVDISYLPSSAIWDSVRRNYWNKTIFLCSPLLLLFIMKRLEIHITEDKPYFMQKRSLLYILIVLLLIYFTTDNGLNFGSESLKYDIAGGFYLLILADLILWKEVYGKSEQKGSRLKGVAFMAFAHVGVLLFFFIENKRLREILSYVKAFFGREIFSGSSRMDSQADWIGYRKTALEAFFSRDLTVLDGTYGKEHYLYSVYGHGLTSIWFRHGMLPLLIMLLLLVLLVISLWDWNQKDIFLNQCARSLAIGYILKMSASFILQVNMIVSPYMEIPFTGMDIAEILLPILLVYEDYRRTKRANFFQTS